MWICMVTAVHLWAVVCVELCVWSVCNVCGTCSVHLGLWLVCQCVACVVCAVGRATEAMHGWRARRRGDLPGRPSQSARHAGLCSPATLAPGGAQGTELPWVLPLGSDGAPPKSTSDGWGAETPGRCSWGCPQPCVDSRGVHSQGPGGSGRQMSAKPEAAECRSPLPPESRSTCCSLGQNDSYYAAQLTAVAHKKHVS